MAFCEYFLLISNSLFLLDYLVDIFNFSDKKGVTGSEVKKSVYLDMLLPRNTSNQYSDSTLVGLRDLPNLAPSAQVVIWDWCYL